MNPNFPNVKYSLNAPAKSYSTEVLRSELKALRHCWMIHLKLNQKKAHESIYKCMTEIQTELKARKVQQQNAVVSAEGSK